MLSALIVLVVAIGSIHAQHAEPTPRVNVLLHVQYEECEGKDGSNYTLWGEWTTDLNGDSRSIADEDHQLIQCDSTGGRQVNLMKQLARSDYPAGAYHQVEYLWLVISGPLQGKYVYHKYIILVLDYLKRYSSVLGYSYVTTKSASLLVNDRLDLSVLINPTGAYEVFRKGCNTQCRGRGWQVA